jgi:glycolate oxidase FAD binding subunit
MMRPTTEAELAEAVAGASGPLLVRGGGTRTLGHAVGEVLETGGLSGVQLYEPGALTLVVRAGTPLAKVEATLAVERQRLAFEPPDLRTLLVRTGTSTIGGVLAANASGPRRVQSGAARDAALGVRFVDGSGTIIKNGGRVMKNVTGYDLVKLFAGSRGTLGILSEVSLKVQAQPEAETTLVVEGLGDEAGLSALRKALGSPFDVSGVARHSGRSLIRVEGMAGSVAYRAAALKALVGADVTLVDGPASANLWREVRDLLPFVDKPGDVWRVATLPTAAAEIAARTEGEAIWDWGGGLVWLRLEPGRGAEVAAAVAGRGHATLVRGAGGPVFPPEAAEVAALAAGLKAKFDPRGILNPGMTG